ncbi:hypothetical protein N431DRAFT_224748 [Stipitochalara longipes BDJ]|nr:hypothetical protein N431DRAFT_224748 [Stipitochalara longipes BDJ]
MIDIPFKLILLYLHSAPKSHPPGLKITQIDLTFNHHAQTPVQFQSRQSNQSFAVDRLSSPNPTPKSINLKRPNSRPKKRTL